jgi:hypothetical protein
MNASRRSSDVVIWRKRDISFLLSPNRCLASVHQAPGSGLDGLTDHLTRAKDPGERHKFTAPRRVGAAQPSCLGTT